VRGLTYQDIAERLGVYRETDTNALNELRVAGLIEIRRKRIKVIDRRRLERAAFDELVAELRVKEEWAYVEREIDIRLVRVGAKS